MGKKFLEEIVYDEDGRYHLSNGKIVKPKAIGEPVVRVFRETIQVEDFYPIVKSEASRLDLLDKANAYTLIYQEEKDRYVLGIHFFKI